MPWPTHHHNTQCPTHSPPTIEPPQHVLPPKRKARGVTSQVQGGMVPPERWQQWAGAGVKVHNC
eukprot:scaffold511_cov111-Isochrysis_galbana.AAC.1